MAETALIGVDIDLSLVNKRLAETGDLTAKEARQMQRELTQAFKSAARESENASKLMARANSKAARDAERDAKRAANAIKSSVNEQTSAIKGLASAAFGGMAGDLFDVADAAGGASNGLAGIGIALGAMAVGPAILGGIAQGLIDTANAGVEAKNALEEAGIAVDQLVTPAALAAIEEYEEQTKLAEQASQALSVQLGGAAARDAGMFNDALLGVKQTLASASESTGGFFATIGKLSEHAVEYSSVGGFLLINALRDQGERAGEAKAKIAALAAEQAELAIEAANAAKSMEDEREMLIALGLLSEEGAAATNRSTDALDRQRASYERRLKSMQDQLKAAQQNTQAEEESTTATKTYAEAMAELEAAMNGAQSAIGITDEQAKEFNETLKDQRDAIISEDGTSPLQAMTQHLKNAGEAALITADALTPIMSNLQQLAAIDKRMHEERISQLADERAASRETYQAAAADYQLSRDSMTATERAAQEAYLSALAQSESAKRKQLRDIEREERKAAMTSYRKEQALQLTQIAIDAARNAVSLTAAFAFAGPLAPVLAAGVAAAQGVTAAQIVSSEPPPVFHFGTSAAGASMQRPAGIVGAEVPAVLEQGEGVISRRGMAAPGMAELVQMVNDGRAPAERSSISDTEADMLAQRLNRPYAPHIRGRAEAGRNTFYRGR
tara:strand:+ start:487 stop:2505 length:2019 start_codon:yes stop_codon:yes gene_type:complete